MSFQSIVGDSKKTSEYPCDIVFLQFPKMRILYNSSLLSLPRE